MRCPRCSFQAIGRYLPLHARMASCALWQGMPLYVAVGLMLLTHSTLMLSGSFRRVRRGVATNMRVGFMGARPSMAMMDSPKSRASGPTDMTAQAYVSLDSLARACPCKRHPSVSFRGRKTGETCQKSGGFHQRDILQETWSYQLTADARRSPAVFHFPLPCCFPERNPERTRLMITT